MRSPFQDKEYPVCGSCSGLSRKSHILLRKRIGSFCLLEWQIVNRIGRTEIRNSRCSRCGCRHYVFRSHGSRCRLGSGGHRAFHFPCIDICEPTSLIFTAVYVKKYCKFFSGLYGCLINAVCTENLEAYFLRVLVMCFQDIFLLFPLVSVFADTALNRQYGDDSSRNFHVSCFY